MGITGIGILYPEDIPEGFDIMADAPNDEDEVKAALARTTQDGSGFTTEDELPESDFESFSEPDVENNHDGDNEPAVEGTEAP